MNTALWWLVQNTVTVLIAIPLVALACRVFYRRPAVQHALWLILLLKLMTPPIAVWPWSFDQVKDLLKPTAPDDRRTVADCSPREIMPRAHLTLLMADAAPATVASPAELPPVDSEAPAASTFDVASALLYLWLVGAAFCAVRQARRIARHTAIVRTAALADAGLMAEIADIAHKIGVRPPRTLLAANILAPFVWFFGRLKLLWPQSLLDRTRSRGVIAHELAHIRRCDHWVAWLELLAGVVWWWNPLFWLVRRRLREAAEMACDALALAVCDGDRREYAELLLELSSGPQTLAPVLGVGAGSASSFERRLTMILSERVSGKVSLWGIITAIALVAVALPGWSLGQQDSGEVLQERRSTNTTVGQLAGDDKQAPDAMAARLRQLQAEIDRLKERLKELGDNAVFTFQGTEGGEYRLKLEKDAMVVEAWTTDGRQKWKTRLAGPKGGISQLHWDGKNFENGKVGKRLSIGLGGIVDGIDYSIDTSNGKIIRRSEMGKQPPTVGDATKTQEDYRRKAIAEYERATAAAEAARKQYERLKFSTNKVTKEELDAAKEYWFAKEKDKQAEAGQLKDRLNAAEAALKAAQRDLERIEILAKEGGASGAEREAALARFRAAQVERTRLEQWLTEKAAQNEVAKNQQRALNEARQAERAAAEAANKVYPDSPKLVSGVRVGQTNGVSSPNALDLAERYLKAVADLKLARSRLARIPRADGAASRQEIEEAEIELERAHKQEQLISAFLADTVRSTQAGREAARNEFQRMEQLVKKGLAETALLDTARARLAAAEAQVRILESAQRIIQNAPDKAGDRNPARR